MILKLVTRDRSRAACLWQHIHADYSGGSKPCVAVRLRGTVNVLSTRHLSQRNVDNISTGKQ